MENNENNNLNELDQLKAQYETLKRQFDQQEIVNDRLMKSSIKRNVGFFTRYRRRQFILYPLAILLGLLVIKWEFGNNLFLRLFLMAYCLVSFAVEIWMLRKLHVKTLEDNDLLTLSNQARGFKVLYTVFVILSAVPMLILSVGLFAHTGYDHFPNFGRFLAVLCATLVLFVSVGIAEIRHKTKPCDEIIRQIDASEAKENKKTGFDKKQKLFCVAMIVVFIGLDLWAYTIVATHLKLPPMWRTVEYVRAENDFSTEGKLEIWEIFGDTLVPEKEVPELLQNINNDKYILLEGQRQGTRTAVDDEVKHSWKHGENNPEEVRLYLLKKNSQEGPAISSAVLGGKPMVAYVEFTYPQSFPDTEPEPIFVSLTSEARQLWYQFTTKIAGRRAAVVMDDVVIQDWQVMCGIENGQFMIMREWSSKEELEAFCECLIKQ